MTDEHPKDDDHETGFHFVSIAEALFGAMSFMTPRKTDAPPPVKPVKS